MLTLNFQSLEAWQDVCSAANLPNGGRFKEFFPLLKAAYNVCFFPVIVADNYGDGAGDNHSDGDGNSDIAPGFYNSNIDKIGDNGDHAPGRASFQVQADLQNPGKESQREALWGQQASVSSSSSSSASAGEISSDLYRT